MTVRITLVQMVDCVWMVSIVIRVTALRVTLENAVWLVGNSLYLGLVGTTSYSLLQGNSLLSKHEVCVFPNWKKCLLIF